MERQCVFLLLQHYSGDFSTLLFYCTTPHQQRSLLEYYSNGSLVVSLKVGRWKEAINNAAAEVCFCKMYFLRARGQKGVILAYNIIHIYWLQL